MIRFFIITFILLLPLSAYSETKKWTDNSGSSYVSHKEYYKSGKVSSEKVYKDEIPISWEYYYESGELKGAAIYKEGKIVSGEYYYQSGELKSKSKYKNGIPVSKKFYYESGELEGDTKYTDGKPVSEIEFFKNGTLKEEKISKDGKKVSWKHYYESGALKSEEKYKNGQLVDWKSYYESGELEEDAPYKNGKKHGVNKRYYKSGAISEKWPYVNGELHGTGWQYFDNGQIKAKEEFKNGNRYGDAIYYYREGTPRTKTSYIDGQINVKEINYYRSGKVKDESFYKQTGAYGLREKNGLFREYYETGELKTRTNYTDGKEHGDSKEYYKNGKIKKISIYKNGVLSGNAKEYFNEGKLKNKILYKDDKAVEGNFEMVIQSGHSGLILDFAFSPDSTLIASNSNGQNIRLWTLDGKLIRSMPTPSTFDKVRFSPDGESILAFVRTGANFKWDLQGKLLNRSRMAEGNQVIPSLNGKLIAIVNKEGKVDVRNLAGKLISSLKMTDKKTILGSHKNGLSFSKDGKNIATLSKSGYVSLWKTDGKEINTFKIKGEATCIAVSPDIKHISLGYKDGTVEIRNLNGKLIKKLVGLKGRIINTVFNPHGDLILATSPNKTMVWNRKGKIIHAIDGRFKLFSPDGKSVIGSINTDIKLYNMDEKKVLTFKSKNEPVRSVSAILDKNIIISDKTGMFSRRGHEVNFWDTTGKLGDKKIQADESILSTAISPDGTYIASKVGPMGKYTFNIWDRKGKLLKTFNDTSNLPVICSSNVTLSFSKDSKHLISIPRYQSFPPFLLNQIKDRPVLECNLNMWSLDGKIVNKVNLALAENEKLSREPDAVPVDTILTDDKKIISVYKNNKIVFRDFDGTITDSLEAKSEKGKAIFRKFALSPKGNFLASGFVNKPLKLWTIKGEFVGKLGDMNASKAVFSDDEKMVATSYSIDRTIKVWRLNGELISTLKGHSFVINDMKFSRDNKFLLSASSDGTIRIWNIKTGDSVALLSSEDEWLMYTDDGYFDASRNGGQLVAMVQGVTAYGIDQFAIRNNRPDIILKRLGLGSEELINHFYHRYKKRLKRAGFTEKNLSAEMHVPKVNIISSKVKGKFIELDFKLSDDKYKVKKYNVYVNDVPIFGAYGKEISGNNATVKEKVELTHGKNKIEVSCFNEKGVESFREITFAEYKKPLKKNLYYLGFGVSKYKDKKLDLKYADKDAADLSVLFKGMTGKQFDNVYVKTWLNENVTTESIKRAKEFIKNAKVDDTVVLFIAGHGVHDRDKDANYYYLTHDAATNNLSGTAANFELIENLLQGVAPRNKLFLIDTCESGEIEEDLQSTYIAMAESRGIKARTTRAIRMKSKKIPKREYLLSRDRYIYNDINRYSGAIVYASSRGNEFSYEKDEFQNGFFTEEIIKAFTGGEADRDKDGSVSIEELKNYVTTAVSRESSGLQNPSIIQDNLYQNVGFPAVQ